MGQVEFSKFYQNEFFTCLKVNGTYPYFSAICTKGNKYCGFLFVSLDKKALSNWINSLRKEFAPIGANSFL